MGLYKFYGNSEFKVGDRARIAEGSGIGSGSYVEITNHFNWREEDGAYKEPTKDYIPVKFLVDNRKEYWSRNRLIKVIPRIYNFQCLLERTSKGAISGPMSPILFMNEACKELGFRYNYLIRVINPKATSSYDHLIAKTAYNKDGKDVHMYTLISDMGNKGVPIGMWFDDDKLASITSVYRAELKDLKYHKSNLEDTDSDCEPFIMVDEYTITELFKQAENSEQFRIQERDKSIVG